MSTTLDTRDRLYAKIHHGLQALGEHRQSYPDWDASLLVAPDKNNAASSPADPADLWQCFAERLDAAHGKPMREPAALAALLRAEQALHGYCDPALVEHFSTLPEFNGFTFETSLDRENIDSYQFGITRAAGAIAESGTLILTDQNTSSRLGALAPWIHIAFLDLSDIFPDISTALDHLGNDPSVVWATGPSKTADIEGILIEGVHGPGIQIAYAP